MKILFSLGILAAAVAIFGSLSWAISSITLARWVEALGRNSAGALIPVVVLWPIAGYAVIAALDLFSRSLRER